MAIATEQLLGVVERAVVPRGLTAKQEQEARGAPPTAADAQPQSTDEEQSAVAA